MNKLLNFILKNKFNILVLVFYIFIVTFTSFHHEMWRDEARVWYLLKNYDLFALAKSIVMDGHPFLWYIILYPFYLLKFNAESMQFVSVFTCIAAAVFMLFKSPFNNFLKILFLFSAGMVYYIPVIARSYCLIPILIFLLAYLYPKRIQTPYKYLAVLILLSQTHSLVWGFCIIASCIFLVELIQACFKTKKFSEPLIVSGVLISYFIINFFIYWYVIKHNNWVGDISGILFKISNSCYDMFNGIMQILSQEGLSYNLRYITFSFFFVILLILFVQNKKLFTIFLLSLLHVLYMSVNIWCDGVIYQKFFVLILILVFCCWVCFDSDNIKYKFLNSVITVFLMFLFVSPFFLKPVFDDIVHTLTNTEEICNIIKKDASANVLVITDNKLLTDNFTANLNCPVHHIVLSQNNEIVSDERINNYDEPIKFIIISENIGFKPNSPFEKVLNPPSYNEKIRYFNTWEYYSLYKNKELQD